MSNYQPEVDFKLWKNTKKYDKDYHDKKIRNISSEYELIINN